MNDRPSDQLIINVTPGKPIKITQVNIVVSGEGQHDCDYQKIIKDGNLFIGKKLKHCDYEDFKNKLYNLALLKGYFNAKFHKSELLVIPSRYQCIWNIDFYSDKRYVLEKITFRGSQIRQDYLDNISNIYVGNYYNAMSVMALSRCLSSTNWFKSVLISSDFSCVKQKKITLNVLFDPQVKNSFEIGFGYATNIGPRAKVVWKKPWINSYGHSLENNLSLSIIEQIFDLSYKIPIFCNPIEQYYLLQGGIIHEDIHQDCISSIATINIARYWNCANNWQCAINMHWNCNYVLRRDIDSKITMLIYPGISINRIRQRGEIMSYWGDSQRYTVSVSSMYWKSDINFIILQARNIWIRTLAKKHRFLIRGNLSWMKTSDWFSVMPFCRFFFIGDDGIRGYKHRSLLFYNTEIFNNVFRLITSSLEYQYNVLSQWWGVIFIDVGKMEGDIRWDSFTSGIGCGIRCQLPVGLMRLDMAIPLKKKQTISYSSLCFYINLGPEL